MVGDVCARGALRMLSVLAFAIAAGTPAAATTFVRMDAPQLAARSDAAVIATVTSVTGVRLAKGAAVTRVVLAPEQVVMGSLPSGRLVLDEPGGRGAATVERVFGAPDYRPGERVLVFVQHTAGGTLRTTGMAMGKFVVTGAGGATVATRRLDDALLLDPAGGAPRESATLVDRLADVLAAVPGKAVRRAARAPSRPAAVPPNAPFTYLGDPSRWFEPDDGAPIRFLIDARGDATLGRDAGIAAAVDGLAAWSRVEGAAVLLEDGSLEAPSPFAGCGGENRIVFDDPFDEIDDPEDCRGVLGIGGYCYSDESRTVEGQVYNRIRLGKAVIANGWGACPQWTACNLAQIATHEIGHAIGLGHSTDANATMAGTARFDGRCGSLGADDVAGVRAIYPAPDTPTPTPTATPPPTDAETDTPTETATPRATATARPSTPTVPPSGVRGVRGRITYYGSGIPVPGVRVNARGGNGTVVLTQGAGDYSVGDLEAGNWMIEPWKDADLGGGAITALDAAMVLQASGGVRALDAEHRVACDVTGNGSVSPLDAARILQAVVGDLPRFPAADLCGSAFAFFPSAAPVTNQEAVEPSLDFDACREGALTYSPLVGQVAEQDFRAALIGDCSANWQPGDSRGAEPVLAPEGTALAVSPLRRLPGGRWRISVGLRSPQPSSALEMELRFDGARLTPAQVRTAHLGDAALLDFVVTQPNRLRIALASALTLPGDGRAVVVVDFVASDAGGITSRSVRAWSASLDDRFVNVPR